MGIIATEDGYKVPFNEREDAGKFAAKLSKKQKKKTKLQDLKPRIGLMISQKSLKQRKRLLKFKKYGPHTRAWKEQGDSSQG